MKRYQEYLTERNESLDGHRATVLETVIEFRASFRCNEVQRRAEQETLLQEPFDFYFDELLQTGIVRLAGQDFVGDYYALDLPHLGASPLGGIWVSCHFCYLAEKARESRSDNADDVAAIEQFLKEQAVLQQEWTDDSVRDFAGDELSRLIETGFRYVQLFDRISLCCSEQKDAAEIHLPCGNTFIVSPRIKDGSCTISPSPFPPTADFFSMATVRRLPAQQYDDNQLRNAMEAASLENFDVRLIGH